MPIKHFSYTGCSIKKFPISEAYNFLNNGRRCIPDTSFWSLNPQVFITYFNYFFASIHDTEKQDINNGWKPPSGRFGRHGVPPTNQISYGLRDPPILTRLISTIGATWNRRFTKEAPEASWMWRPWLENSSAQHREMETCSSASPLIFAPQSEPLH